MTGPALHHNDLHQLDDDDKYAHLSTSKPTEYLIWHQSMPDFLLNRPEWIPYQSQIEYHVLIDLKPHYLHRQTPIDDKFQSGSKVHPLIVQDAQYDEAVSKKDLKG